MDGGGKAVCAGDRIDTKKTALGPEHPDTLTSMWNLSLTLKDLRRHDEALSMLQACVQLRNQRLGPSHPHTVKATATLKRWQKRFEDPSIQGPASTRRSPFPRAAQIHIQSNLHYPR